MDERKPLPSWVERVILPPSLYDAGEREGYDMRFYIKQQPIPLIGRK